jgi:hypothetical protein
MTSWTPRACSPVPGCPQQPAGIGSPGRLQRPTLRSACSSSVGGAWLDLEREAVHEPVENHVAALARFGSVHHAFGDRRDKAVRRGYERLPAKSQW